jgi:hypothetical protein
MTSGAEGLLIAPSVGYSLESIYFFSRRESDTLWDKATGFFPPLKYLQSVPPPDKVWEAIQANTTKAIDKTNARIQEA